MDGILDHLARPELRAQSLCPTQLTVLCARQVLSKISGATLSQERDDLEYLLWAHLNKFITFAILSLRVSFCTRHMPNDSQSQSTFAASPSKDMPKYDQPVKKPMMYTLNPKS